MCSGKLCVTGKKTAMLLSIFCVVYIMYVWSIHKKYNIASFSKTFDLTRVLGTPAIIDMCILVYVSYPVYHAHGFTKESDSGRPECIDA